MNGRHEQISARAVVLTIDGPPRRRADGRNVVSLTLTVMIEGESPFRSRIEAPSDGLVEGEHVAVLIDPRSRRVELDRGTNRPVGGDSTIVLDE